MSTISNKYLQNEQDAYMDIIGEYGVLTDAEAEMLWEKQQKGDLEARNRLIEGNLRLVVPIAKHYYGKLQHFQYLDIVQEGNLGIIKAVDTFDTSFGTSFSTYATQQAITHIKHAIKKKESAIIISSSKIIQDIKNYRRLLISCRQSGKPIPTDSEACVLLGITPLALQKVKASYRFKLKSLDENIDRTDKESLTIGNTIENPVDEYKQLLDKSVDAEYLIALKEILGPLKYYIMYHIFIEKSFKEKELASTLGITKAAVNLQKRDILKRLRGLFFGERITINQKITEVKKREGVYFSNLKVEPISPNDIASYLYMRDFLTEQENEILKQILLGKYDFSIPEMASYFHIPLEQFKMIYQNIREKIAMQLKQKDKFEAFKNSLLQTHGTKIFKLETENDQIGKNRQKTFVKK